MNFYALSGLINALTATVLGAFVYLRAPADPKHRIYGLFCLSVSVWSYFYCAWQLADSRELALLFSRLLMAGAIMAPILYFHHVLMFLGTVESHRALLKAGYLLGAVFLTLDATPLMVAKVAPELWFPHWPKPGLAFHVFLAWFGFYACLTVFLLGLSLRQTTGLRRNQIVYVLIGSLIGYAGGITNFPLWYGIPIPPDGTILITAYTAIIAYTIVRYRLMDFGAAMEKGLTFLFLLIFVGLPAFAILEAAQRVYFDEVNYQFSIILLCLFVLIAAGVYKLKTGAQTAIARTLFRQRYDMYETLSAFSRSLVTILDLRSLTEEIVRTLANTIGITTASLYLLDKEKDVYQVASAIGVGVDALREFRVGAREDLPQHLVISQSTLVREELEHAPGQEGMKAILKALVRLQAEVCIPLINKDRLIGFCNLGPRRNHGIYSEDDLRLLTTLAQNAAIALDNAGLYEELKRSQILMRRTDRLRSLETIAGGFAHEIRNPLTSIKTFIQLAPQRKDDPEFMGYFSKVVSEDVDRIERLIQEILDYARYMEPRLSEEDVNDVVASCLYFIEVKASSKSVAIEKRLASDLPLVMMDRQQIKQVLLNLFLNAMDAMADQGGRLTVITHRLTKPTGDPWVQIEVSDTGVGISSDNLEHIFDPFYTTKHESGEREGTGLGLTIVHQIIHEHRGYIEVESTVGQGTTFYVNLPSNPSPTESEKERVAHEETRPVSRR